MTVLDIKHLQYFIQVTHFKSFTKAAEHLFITQPTISKMIKNLETELGVELFDRSRKQLTLTDAGRVVLEQAKLIDRAFNNLEREVESLSGFTQRTYSNWATTYHRFFLFPKYNWSLSCTIS